MYGRSGRGDGERADAVAAGDGVAAVAGDPVGRLFGRYAAGELWLFVAGVIASILGRGVSLVPPLVLGVAIDSVFNDSAPYRLPLVPPELLPAGRVAQLWLSVGLVLGAFVLGVAFTWTQGATLSLFSNCIQQTIRVDAYRAMQGLDMAFFDDKQTGQVMSILNDDIRNLRQFLGSTVSNALTLVVTVIGIGGVLFWLNWQLALVTLVAVPLLTGFTVWFMRAIRPRYWALRASVGALNTRLENNISGMEVIKTSTPRPTRRRASARPPSSTTCGRGPSPASNTSTSRRWSCSRASPSPPRSRWEGSGSSLEPPVPSRERSASGSSSPSCS